MSTGMFVKVNKLIILSELVVHLGHQCMFTSVLITRIFHK